MSHTTFESGQYVEIERAYLVGGPWSQDTRVEKRIEAVQILGINDGSSYIVKLDGEFRVIHENVIVGVKPPGWFR